MMRYPKPFYCSTCNSFGFFTILCNFLHHGLMLYLLLWEFLYPQRFYLVFLRMATLLVPDIPDTSVSGLYSSMMVSVPFLCIVIKLCTRALQSDKLLKELRSLSLCRSLCRYPDHTIHLANFPPHFDSLACQLCNA